MTLIPNWQKFPKLWSVWCFGAIVAIQGGISMVPEFASMHPGWWTGHTYSDVAAVATGLFAVLGTFLRIVSQEPTT